MKVAVFPGSFDPITIGHKSVIERSLSLFDKIVVAIGNNSQKKYYFELEKRMELINLTFKNNSTIEVANYKGLTVDFCKKIGAQYILRGVRDESDFTFEKSIAQMNKKMHNEVETIFLPTTPELSSINSSIVRDIIVNGGDANQFIPQEIRNHL